MRESSEFYNVLIVRYPALAPPARPSLAGCSDRFHDTWKITISIVQNDIITNPQTEITIYEMDMTIPIDAGTECDVGCCQRETDSLLGASLSPEIGR